MITHRTQDRRKPFRIGALGSVFDLGITFQNNSLGWIAAHGFTRGLQSLLLALSGVVGVPRALAPGREFLSPHAFPLSTADRGGPFPSPPGETAPARRQTPIPPSAHSRHAGIERDASHVLLRNILNHSHAVAQLPDCRPSGNYSGEASSNPGYWLARAFGVYCGRAVEGAALSVCANEISPKIAQEQYNPSDLELKRRFRLRQYTLIYRCLQ